MKLINVLFLILVFTLSLISETREIKKPELPEVRPVIEKYFGKSISDPYRYLEDLKDEQVLKWYKDNADYARSVLDSIPGRQTLIKKMEELNSRRATRIYFVRILENDIYFYLKRKPEEQMGKLYYRKGWKGNEVLLFDPETLSTNPKTKFSLRNYYPSYKGAKLALVLSSNDSGNHLIRILDVVSGKMFPEVIDRCFWPQCSWLPDESAFFFTRLNSNDIHTKEREKNTKAYLHIPGKNPSEDRLILSRELCPELKIEPEEFIRIKYEKNANILIAYAETVDLRIKSFYAGFSELSNKKIKWKFLFKRDDNVHKYVLTENEILFLTPRNAPNYKIMKMSLKKPDINKAEDVIPAHPVEVLKSFKITSDGYYFSRSLNGVIQKLYFKEKGSKKIEEITPPVPAGSLRISVKGISSPDVWINVSGWINSSRRYRLIPHTFEFIPENLSTLVEYPEYEDLVVEELMVPSHDGVRVPLSLIYKKGLKRDGSNPVFITGYGAYGESISPGFRLYHYLWCLKGGIFAVSHVRGGGELGDKWYKGGFKSTKRNTWKDFIACAEYLVKEKYSSPNKIAAYGVSAGGITVGRAMTERPDLFGAVIPSKGLMNTLRSEAYPNGPVNAPEFGTVKVKSECMDLIEMDSYLHIRDGINYPATLIKAGMNDANVIAWQPGKFAARLMAANDSDNPILFFPDYKAGHGSGSTLSRAFKSLADELSFAWWQTSKSSSEVEQ